ncbi:hypothetical protein J3U01_07095 [Bifidobacterium sp. B4107]|uniref:hypothetical protein n=1 Tax=unclassified Bifidobacterium TaxID=2608897 RepID=UPI00226B6E6E|nr:MULTISPECIES: hypothetical protein [unclassified Bifidobacterium]MCX8648170.1 hypothetical protein [Bifidobacterium sp. B4107]MCX8652352.1 hypothetical protein [Bifidobacterium sp. B4111]MCX8658783.1 hypothetical protein [Bifidobacterium sp. B4114]
MSDKEWYTNLSRYELEGKHVHVLFSDGTMEGSLNLLGQIVYWNSDVGLKHVQILDWNKDSTWTRAVGVESVSMVWDERDWQELGPAEYRKADAIVVNGRLLQVTRVMRNAFLVGDRDPVPVPFVSCALRHKAKLPTEPGIYRGADGTLLIRLKSLLEADIWMCVSKDFLEDGAYVGDEVARKYLPLTPVHFVDGRAE